MKYWYSVRFIGRLNGAQGIFHEITDVVESLFVLNGEEIGLRLCEKYEHIRDLDIIDMGVNTKHSPSKNKSYTHKGDL